MINGEDWSDSLIVLNKINGKLSSISEYLKDIDQSIWNK